MKTHYKLDLNMPAEWLMNWLEVFKTSRAKTLVAIKNNALIKKILRLYSKKASIDDEGYFNASICINLKTKEDKAKNPVLTTMNNNNFLPPENDNYNFLNYEKGCYPTTPPPSISLKFFEIDNRFDGETTENYLCIKNKLAVNKGSVGAASLNCGNNLIKNFKMKNLQKNELIIRHSIAYKNSINSLHSFSTSATGVEKNSSFYVYNKISNGFDGFINRNEGVTVNGVLQEITKNKKISGILLSDLSFFNINKPKLKDSTIGVISGVKEAPANLSWLRRNRKLKSKSLYSEVNTRRLAHKKVGLRKKGVLLNKAVNFLLESKKLKWEYKRKARIFRGVSSKRRFHMFKKGLKNWKQFSYLKPNLKNKPFLLKSNWDNRKVWKNSFFFKHARRKDFFRNKSLIRLYFMRYLMLRKNSQLKSFLRKYKKGKGHLLRYHLMYESKLDNFIIQWGFLRLLTQARSRFIIRAGFTYIDFICCKNPDKTVQPVNCVTLTYAGSRAHSYFYHWTNIGSTKWHKSLAEYRHLSRKKKISRVIKLNSYRRLFWKFRLLKLSHWNKKYFTYFFRFFEASSVVKAFVYFFFNEWYSYKFSRYFNFMLFDRRLNSIFLKTRLF